MKKISFIKMHGAGNDFVLLDRGRIKTPITPKLAVRLLDRHFGIGGDQLLILTRKEHGQPPQLEFYNADGSMAEMCGNGARAAAAYLRDHHGRRGHFLIQTPTRLIEIDLNQRGIEVDMGEPVLDGPLIPVRSSGPVVDHPLRVAGQTLRLHAVSMGNPHAVIFVRRLDRFPVATLGPLLERHPFFPRRVNVEFVQVMSPSRVRARVWERGAGETLACGTGACAIAVAAARFNKTRRKVAVDLPGGQLGVRWAENNHVFLTGPTQETFRGEFNLT